MEIGIKLSLDHLMLFYTGIKRTSADVTQKFLDDLDGKKRQLRIMKDLVKESIQILNSQQDIKDLGELLHEARRHTLPLLEGGGGGWWVVGGGWYSLTTCHSV